MSPMHTRRDTRSEANWDAKSHCSNSTALSTLHDVHQNGTWLHYFRVACIIPCNVDYPLDCEFEARNKEKTFELGFRLCCCELQISRRASAVALSGTCAGTISASRRLGLTGRSGSMVSTGHQKDWGSLGDQAPW